MIGLTLFVLLLFVGVAWATSLVVGAIARPARTYLARVEPAARARIWLTAALAPAIVGVSVVCASVGGWAGRRLSHGGFAFALPFGGG